MLCGYKRMELRHLRYFAAVADAGNVSLAARRLNVTQPALSRQIQDLERDFACRLFDRIGRRIVLTRDGDEILERTRRLLADAEARREGARALAGGEAGVLRLGTTPQFIEAALPEVLTRYARTYPGIEVKLAEDGGGTLLRRCSTGSYILPSGYCAPKGFGANRYSQIAYWPSSSNGIGWQVEPRCR
jgi:DNA-binding transcriptional LysR family regulator